MEVVGGSIPLATTISPTWAAGLTRRPGIPESRTLRGEHSPEVRMLKFLGSTVGIIFLIGLVVVILLLKAIF
jgi:hypothetical protein